jgi:hypothetical protein
VAADVRCAANNDQNLAALRLVEMGHEQTHAPQQIAAICYNPRPTAKHYGTPQSTICRDLSSAP